MADNIKKTVSRGELISSRQKEILVDFLDTHPELVSGKFSSSFTFKSAQILWQEVTTILNSVVPGTKKDWRQWRKTWQDLKKNSKSKCARIKRHACATGGGVPTDEKLNNIDNKIMEFISPTLMDGDPTIDESVVIYSFEDNVETENFESEYVIEEVDNGITVDHDYVATSQQNLNKKGKKKFLTKSSRLENSLKISKELVDTSNKKCDINENYYKEKIELIKEEQNRRTMYEKKKIELLSKRIEIDESILEVLRNIESKML